MFWLVLVVSLTVKTTTSVVIPAPYSSQSVCLDAGKEAQGLNKNIRQYFCVVKPS